MDKYLEIKKMFESKEDEENAIALVEKNYKFDIRNVDISCDGYAVSKRRFPRQKIFSKK